MHDTVEKVKADYKDILNDEHMGKPMNAPPVGFFLKKNIKIVPYRVRIPRRTPMHLQASSAEYVDSLRKKGIVEDVPVGAPATEWLLESFFVKRPHSDKARLIIEVLSQVLPGSC